MKHDYIQIIKSKDGKVTDQIKEDFAEGMKQTILKKWNEIVKIKLELEEGNDIFDMILSLK